MNYVWLTTGLRSLRICSGASGNIGQIRLVGAQSQTPVPKKTLTPYFRFQAQMSPEIQKSNPSLEAIEVAKLVEMKWSELDEASKHKYSDGFVTEMSNSSSRGLDEHSSVSSASGTSGIREKSKNKPDKLYKTIELEILGYEQNILDSYQWFVLTAANHLELQIGKVWAPDRPDYYRFVLNKSAHVHKKVRVHYEVRTHHRFINLHKLTGSTADTFLEYIERNLPESIGLKITKAEVLPLPNFLEDKTE